MSPISSPNDSASGTAFGTLVRSIVMGVLGLAVLFGGVRMNGVGDQLKASLVGFVESTSWNLPTTPLLESLSWFLGSSLEALPLVALTLFLALGKNAAGGLQARLQMRLRNALYSATEFIQGEKGSGSKSLGAWFHAWIALAVFFGSAGWIGIGSVPAPNEVTYMVGAPTDENGLVRRVRVPVSFNLHVGFDRAGLDANSRPSGQGVELERVRWKTLEPTVQMLKNCAAGTKKVLKVNVLGFASDEPFLSFENNKHRNEKLNLETANRRALSVRDALSEMVGQDSRIEIEESGDWETYRQMREFRKTIIRAGRTDHYAHRAVVLQVPELANCKIEGPGLQSEVQRCIRRCNLSSLVES